MSRLPVAMIASLIALGGMLWMLARPGQTPPGRTSGEPARPLILFCAASNRAVMEAIRQDYLLHFGRELQVQYGGSQTLLSALQISRTGDLYLPADESYLRLPEAVGLLTKSQPVAEMKLVVAVRRGNPLGVHSLEDLLRPDVRLVGASPEAAAVGQLTRRVLGEQGLWQPLADAMQGNRLTVTDVANDILVGAADAGIVYDAVLDSYPGLEGIEVEPFRSARARIEIGLLNFSRQPDAARRFIGFLLSDRGQRRYAEFGFHPMAPPAEPGSHERSAYEDLLPASSGSAPPASGGPSAASAEES